MSFNCRLKVLTQAHTQGRQLRLSAHILLPRMCPPPAGACGVQNAACYLLLLFVLVKLPSGLEEISWEALFTPPPCCK